MNSGPAPAEPHLRRLFPVFISFNCVSCVAFVLQHVSRSPRTFGELVLTFHLLRKDLSFLLLSSVPQVSWLPGACPDSTSHLAGILVTRNHVFYVGVEDPAWVVNLA